MLFFLYQKVVVLLLAYVRLYVYQLVYDKRRLCNMDIISQVQQVICFAFHDSRLLMETCQEAKNMRKIVTLFYLDWQRPKALFNLSIFFSKNEVLLLLLDQIQTSEILMLLVLSRRNTATKLVLFTERWWFSSCWFFAQQLENFRIFLFIKWFIFPSLPFKLPCLLSPCA